MQGIFSDHLQNHFRDYHRVWVRACSSDQWVGDAVHSSPEAPLIHYRGSKIVTAVFHDLADPNAAPFTVAPPPGRLATHIQPGHLVLFGGNSKASAGMRHNLDRVAAQLGASVATYGVSDAAFAPGLSGPQLPLSAQTTQEIFTILDARYDATCMAAAQEPWRCARLTYLLNADELETELFVYMDTLDHLSMSNRGWDPADPKHRATFGAAVRDFFRYASLVSTSPGGITGVFSTCEGHHTIMMSNNFGTDFTTSAGNPPESFNEVLHQWVEDHVAGAPSRSYNVHSLESISGSACPL